LRSLYLTILSLVTISAWAHFPTPAPTRLAWEENKGQVDGRAVYYIQQRSYHAYIENDGIQFLFFDNADMEKALGHPAFFWETVKPHLIKGHAMRMSFIGAQHALITPSEQFPGIKNYFKGTQSATDCRLYGKVIQQNLYAGIHAEWYTNDEGSIKYDLKVLPGAEPASIQIQYEGADHLSVQTDGTLSIHTSVNEYRELAPYAYQWVNGQKKQIACSFQLDSMSNAVSFKLGEYDKNLLLVIDPALIFSTYSGSTVDNFGATATYDAAGNLYAAGITTGPLSGYPVTAGAFDITYNGGLGSWPQISFSCDISISKYNNDGTALVYATYLGGNRNDYVHSLVAGKLGDLAVYGTTLSRNFPVTPLGYDTSFNDTFDIVVTRLTPGGNALIGSTYIGGSGIDGISIPDTLCMNYMDHMRGEIQFAPNGDIIVGSVTSSNNFPITSGVFQPNRKGGQDGCVFRFNSGLTTLKWSSYLGDTLNETLNGIEVLPSNEILLTGGTHSKHIVAKGSVADSIYNGGISDGWIAKVNANGDTLLKMMYWGTNDYDQIYATRVDRFGNVYVLGQTFGNWNSTAGVYKRDSGSLFITSFTPQMDSVRFSTVLGNGTPKNVLVPSAFMVDYCGAIYGSVWAGSINNSSTYRNGAWRLNVPSSTNGMAVTPNAIQTATDGEDFYLFALSPNADSLLYGTFLGEFFGEDHVDGGTSRFDARGVIYQSVCASCGSGTFGTFPTTSGSFSPTNKSPRCSNASLKMDFRVSGLVTADFTIEPKRRCTDSSIFFINNSYNANAYQWFINDTLADTTTNLQRIFTQPGRYTIKLLAIDSNKCNIADSITKTLTVGTSIHAAFITERDTCTPTIFFRNLTITSTGDTLPVLWDFGDGTTSTLQNPQKIYASSDNYPVYMYVIDSLGCTDTLFQAVDYNRNVHLLSALLSPIDSVTCEPKNVMIFSFGNGGKQFEWYINDTFVSANRNLDTVLYKGTYFIKQIVIDSATCKIIDSVFSYIKIMPEVFPDFKIVRDSCSLTLQFTNTSLMFPNDSVEFIWYFGDGDSAIQKDAVHTYDIAGTYTIGLRVNKGLWCEYLRTKDFTLDNNNLVLDARFTVTPDTICVPTSVTFNNTSINGIRYYWYVNDTLMDSTSNYLHTFSQKGTYDITLIIFDTVTCYQSDTFTKTIEVFPSVTPSFIFYRDTCSADIIFENTTDTTNESLTTFSWDFGDGNISSDYNPSHLYANNGTYIVTLTTNPGLPCSRTVTNIVEYDTSQHILLADFDIADSAYCIPVRIQTINNSINNKYNRWYLNDTFFSANITIDTTIIRAGNFVLKLIIFDSATCKQTDTTFYEFTTEDFADANFILERDSCSLEVKFVNQSSNLSTPFIWNFGDGDTSTEVHPKHQYTSTNTYTITLIANNGSLCADTMIKNFYIDGDTSTMIRAANVFTPNNDGLNDCYSIDGVHEKCDEFHIWIRNRWGNLFFESTNPKQCWDGKNEKGEEASAGVYYYIVQIKKRSGKVYNTNGTIQLIR